MTRMREVAQPAGHGPVAAHEWEPLLGSCTVGPWPMGCCLSVLPELESFRRCGGEVAGGAGGSRAATGPAAGRDRSRHRVAALGAGAGGRWAAGEPVLVRADSGVLGPPGADGAGWGAGGHAAGGGVRADRAGVAADRS